MKIKAWISAFRLRTLPLSLSGIIVGTFIAKLDGHWNTTIFILALITTVLFQIVSNLANDLGDSQKGTDNEHRVGPTRAVQSGELSQQQMKNAVIVVSVLSFISAGLLIFVSAQNLSKEIIWFYGILAVLCVLSAITYTVGKRAYGYNGMGDIMVFLFFGLVSVLGVYSLYTSSFSLINILPATSIGLLSAAVLNLNNMRDIENDGNSGKKTQVVRMGLAKAKSYHYLLIIVSFFCFGAFLFMKTIPTVFFMLPLLPFLLLGKHLQTVSKVNNPRDFDPELKKVALSTFGISILFTIVVLIAA